MFKTLRNIYRNVKTLGRAPWDDFWYSPLVGGILNPSGVRVTPASARQASAVYACVLIYASTMHAVPCNLYQRDPRDPRRKRLAVEHPLFWVLHDQANPRQHARAWRKFVSVMIGYRGNAYSWIERDPSGQVRNLWPIHSDLVTPEQQDDGRIVYRVRTKSGMRDYGELDILHQTWWSDDGVIGVSPIEAGAMSIGADLAANQTSAAFFKNGMHLGGSMEHPGKLSDAAYKRLRDSMDEDYAGSDKTGRNLILEEGMKYNKMTITPEEAQFMETMRFRAVDIARFYRMQPHKIQEMSRATYANIEMQAIEHVVDTIQPFASMFEEAMEQKLLTEQERRDGFYIRHNLNALLRGDINSRYGAFAVGRQWGWLSVNDIREIEDMNPVENGDEYLSPMNMQPLGTPPEPRKPARPPMDEEEDSMMRGLRVMALAARNGNGTQAHHDL